MRDSSANAAAERSASKALEAVYQRELAERAGARLAAAAGANSWASVLPLIGAAISGAVEGATATAVARRAKMMFIDSCAATLPQRECSWCGAACDQLRAASAALHPPALTKLFFFHVPSKASRKVGG